MNAINENASAMPKEQYLTKLERALHAMPYTERSEIMRYYEEYFLEATDEELEKLGTPDALAARILAENNEDTSAENIGTVVENTGSAVENTGAAVENRNEMPAAVKIILLVLTSPVWLMLLLAWYIVLLSAVVSLASIEIMLAVVFPMSITAAVMSMVCYSYLPYMLIYLGEALIGGGAALLLYRPFFTACKAILRFLVFTTKRLWRITGLGGAHKSGKERISE